jgi:predicted nucleic acid-binding protein
LTVLVTGRKARYQHIPRDAFMAATAQHTGTFVALDLWEMYNAFADLGFAAAGEPEALNNTKEVWKLLFLEMVI